MGKERVVGIAKKYPKLAWECIGGGIFALAVMAACIWFYGFALDKSFVAICILGGTGIVLLYFGIRHLLSPNILIVTDNSYIYMVYTKKVVEKIAMADVKSIFPTAHSRSANKQLKGIEIKTFDGREYVRGGIMFRYEVIQALADKIFEVTGNTIDYYSLRNLDGSAVYEDN